MANRQNILQSLRHRADGLGRLLLPALAGTLLCPAGIVCAEGQGAPAQEHGIAAHEHSLPVSGHSDDGCPHCPAHASAMSGARASCDVDAEDSPAPAKLPRDLHLATLPSAIGSEQAIPHPSPPRTAFSTGAGPPAIPLNLLHCILLI
jgi:hypothetical protein